MNDITHSARAQLRSIKHGSKTASPRFKSRKAERSRFPRPQESKSFDPRQNYERYLALARAETLAGDRIAAENYLQHAEHYWRSMHKPKQEPQPEPAGPLA